MGGGLIFHSSHICTESNKTWKSPTFILIKLLRLLGKIILDRNCREDLLLNQDRQQKKGHIKSITSCLDSLCLILPVLCEKAGGYLNSCSCHHALVMWCKDRKLSPSRRDSRHWGSDLAASLHRGLFSRRFNPGFLCKGKRVTEAKELQFTTAQQIKSRITKTLLEKSLLKSFCCFHVVSDLHGTLLVDFSGLGSNIFSV